MRVLILANAYIYIVLCTVTSGIYKYLGAVLCVIPDEDSPSTVKALNKVPSSIVYVQNSYIKILIHV